MKKLCLSIDVGYKNFAYALIEIDTPTWTLKDWNCLDLSLGSKGKQGWEKNVTSFLKSFMTDEALTDIIFEQQFVAFNQILAAFIKGYMTKAFPNATIKSVAPASKGVKEKLNYRQRKQLSVDRVEKLKEKISPQLFSTWKERLKKDDMADAFIQSLKTFQLEKTIF
jgi:hypothetical protein